MTFDHELHELHPQTGFAVHKEDGRLVGIHSAPIERVHHDTEYPKWIVPHPGHIIRSGDSVVTPHWTFHDVDRYTGGVKVMVHSEEEETLALGEPAGALVQEVA